jgi:hypothetical protein
MAAALAVSVARAGTVPDPAELLRSIDGASLDSFGGLTAAGDAAFLFSRGAETAQLWISRGSAESTQMVTETPLPDRVTSAGNLLFFTTTDSGLWRSDGSASGTFELTRPAGVIEQWAAVGSTLFFTVNPGKESTPPCVAANELWRSDGTIRGTTRVVRQPPGVLQGGAHGALAKRRDPGGHRACHNRACQRRALPPRKHSSRQKVGLPSLPSTEP